MSHYADSKASFQHRALEIGLQDDQVGPCRSRFGNIQQVSLRSVWAARSD